MPHPGTTEMPLRVAVVGAGPAGFYAAELLLREDTPCEVDLFEALPSPYGLVRMGVAPDHPKMRSVIARFDKTGEEENFNYFGNIRLGEDISVETMLEHYDALLVSTGSQVPRNLGVPGEDLAGSWSAGEFIDWYNAHPDKQHPSFDLSSDTAVVIGNGNVALDIARVLSHKPETLAETDMPTPVIAELAKSNVKTVYIVGRRGPIQASFTAPEIRELDILEHADFDINQSALELEPEDLEELESKSCAQARKFMPVFQERAATEASSDQQIRFRFLRSPVKIEGNGKVEQIVLQKNKLQGEAGSRKPVAIDETETIPCGLVFSCIGYSATPIPGFPFDDSIGRIPNEEGRVTENGAVVPGLYTSGWIKRGPTGVIGTNKVDSKETVCHLIEDAPSLKPAPNRDSQALRKQLIADGKRPITYADWKKIDDTEVARAADGKPREKFLTVEEMLAVLD